MPGGFCRISDQPDARAVSMGEGVESADVWVLADRPVEAATLLPTPEKVRIVRMLGNLPSRAADNLFWFGRYLEREEATLRLVRCLCARAVDPDAPMHGARQSIERLKGLLVAWGAIDAEAARATVRPRPAKRRCATTENYGSALSIARAARHAASVIRERLTPQTWQLIGRLETIIARSARRPSRRAGDPRLRRRGADRRSPRSPGLFDENFNRGAGWVFYELGRRIERGINTCRLARQFAGQDATEYDLDVLLDLIDSQITYRSRTLIGVALAPVRDMALLDPFNPRSVAFQVNADRRASRRPARAAAGRHARGAAPARDAAARRTRRPNTPTGVDDPRILAIEQRLTTLAEAIATRYFLQGAAHAPRREGHGPRVIYDIRISRATATTRRSPSTPACCACCRARRTGQRVLDSAMSR